MIIRVIPQPQGMTWRDWADTVVGYNAALVNQLGGDLDWHDFAARLALLFPATPRAESFGDWETWAEATRSALQL